MSKDSSADLIMKSIWKIRVGHNDTGFTNICLFVPYSLPSIYVTCKLSLADIDATCLKC